MTDKMKHTNTPLETSNSKLKISGTDYCPTNRRSYYMKPQVGDINFVSQYVELQERDKLHNQLVSNSMHNIN